MQRAVGCTPGGSSTAPISLRSPPCWRHDRPQVIGDRTHTAALIFTRRSIAGTNRSEVLASIDRRAVGERRVSEGRSAIVLERAEDWIGIDLIAGASEEPAEVIPAQIVAKRGDKARAKGRNGRPRCSPVEDAVAHRRAMRPAGGYSRQSASSSSRCCS